MEDNLTDIKPSVKNEILTDDSECAIVDESTSMNDDYGDSDFAPSLDEEAASMKDNSSDTDFAPPKKKVQARKKNAVAKAKAPRPRKTGKNTVTSQPGSRKRKQPTSTKNFSSKKIKVGGNIKTEEVESEAIKAESCSYDESSVLSKSCLPSGNVKYEVASDQAPHFSERWRDEEVVAVAADVPLVIAKNVLQLLNQDCTIPFIVRYRKEKTGGLQAEKLREIQESYEEVKQVRKKVENILKTVKDEKFDRAAADALLRAKTLEEVELLYAPFKPGSKKTLAERSRQLGLDPLACQILECQTFLSAVDFSSYIKNQKGLETVKNIKTGLQHIIADVFSKDSTVLDFVRSLSKHNSIRISSKESASAKKMGRRAAVEGKKTDNFKYENYFNMDISVKHIAHHQVMALNRGEKQKVLTVKVQVPVQVQRQIKDFIWKTYFGNKRMDQETQKFLHCCLGDSYERLIEPHMCRQIRSDLTKKAEKESISIFCSNVKSLLLTPPVRGKTVVGIDPGFSHGCKLAAVSSQGVVLKTDVIYPHSQKKMKGNFDDALKLKDMITDFNAEIIAIGNGTACRETEQWLSDVITSKYFEPLSIKYCIVNESGISIYSVTKEAETELPNMDPNVRSAVAIARRLQDPLLEYVKVEPKHLGVGMYQHDVSETQLKKALDSVVEECVSFVGVDLNVCPEVLLRKISGLTASRAKQIVEWRTQNGPFVNREQLREVKGLGPKSYEQCAGFVKILPETSQFYSSETRFESKKSKACYKPNPLDRTIIHPESYAIADKFLNLLDANPYEIGIQSFVDKVCSFIQWKSIEELASSLNAAVPVTQLIIDAFKQLQDYDIRKEFDQPLFKTSVRKFSDLQPNQELTGRVMNIVSFGAFVDVGVEKDGLIHSSQMRGRTLNVGDKVTVRVLSVHTETKRIQLQLK